MGKKEYTILNTETYESVLNMLSELPYKFSAKIISELIVNAKENIDLDVWSSTRDEVSVTSDSDTK